MARKNSDTNLPIQTAQFNASVGQEQLSYICAYCGKVNPIAAGKCLRCGKRRPRNEFLSALNKSKQTSDFRDTLSAEMAQAELDRKEAQDMQLVRLVEERVADEKAQMQAIASAKREQDRDAVQRLAARDAALRVIEAERRAEEAERRAQEAIEGKARETEELLRVEREKATYAAAKKVVSERMGIEQAAEERINIARAEIQKEANKALADSVDSIEKDAARRAVMKVIAAEQSTEDRIRLERESSQRAAMERIKEEKERISMYEQAKHEAEKEGIQRAVEERLRAEREIFGRVASQQQTENGGTAAAGVNVVSNTNIAGMSNNNGRMVGTMPAAYPGAPYLSMPQQNPVTIQPLAIVPYLNSQQPLYQYDPNQPRTMYRFVPDAPPEPEEGEFGTDPLIFEQPQEVKRGGKRFLGILQMLLSALMIFLAVFRPTFLGSFLGGGGEPLLQIKTLLNFSELSFPTMLYPILWAAVVVMTAASFIQGLVRLIRGRLMKAGWILGLLLFALIVVTYFLPSLIADPTYVSATAGEGIMLLVVYAVISFVMLTASIVGAMTNREK